jgi:hypothetical protein
VRGSADPAHGDDAITPSFRAALDRHSAMRRLVMSELALRLYRQERGEFPKSLESLVPQFLPAVPIDPFSGKPLVYRSTGNAVTL